MMFDVEFQPNGRQQLRSVSIFQRDLPRPRSKNPETTRARVGEKGAKATAVASQHVPCPIRPLSRKSGWNKKNVQSDAHALTSLSSYSPCPREPDTELVSTTPTGRHRNLVIFLPPFCFTDNSSYFFGHTLPRRTLELLVLLVGLDPLFYVFDLFFGESRDLRSRGGKGDNGNLSNLRV